MGLGIAYLQLQRYRESVDILRRGHKVAPEACGVTALLADALILAGDRAQGTELARTVLRQGRAAGGDLRCAVTASAALGDADTMFELLGQYEARGVSFQDLLVDVQILRYRHDVRYHDLLKRTDLLPYAAEAPALGASWLSHWQG